MLHDMLLTLSPTAASALKVGSAADMSGLPVRDLPLEPYLLFCGAKDLKSTARKSTAHQFMTASYFFLVMDFKIQTKQSRSLQRVKNITVE